MTEVDDPEPRVASLFKMGRPSVSAAEARRAKAMVLARMGTPAPLPSVGRYQLRDRIGSGGFGDVYVAFDDRLERQVAVKVLHSGRGVRQPDALLDEARAMAKLAHRNVVAVHDAGEHDGEMYIVMDLVEGETLADWLAKAPRTWREVFDVFVEAGRGLGGAHAVGLVHRDFKPANVLMGTDGRVQVTDFGLAAPARALEGPAERAGTRGYWAPEVEASGGIVGPAADQFSYCVALGEALHDLQPPAPRWLLRQVARGRSQAPVDRWPSMEALVDAMTGRRRRGERGRRLALIGGAFGLCSAGVTAVALTRASRPCETLATSSTQTLAIAAPRIEAAFAEAKPARGALVWQAQHARLEHYAERTGAKRRDVCEALHHGGAEAHGDTNRRTQFCLEQRAWELESLVRVFEGADASVVEHAANAVSLMVEQPPCDAVDVTLPLPTGEQYLATLDIRRELADVTELQHAGRYADALRGATRAELDAVAVGYAPLTARASFLRGVQLLFLQRPDEAKSAFESSLAEAHRGRDPERAAWAQTLLAQTVGVYARESAAGVVWADAAEASLSGLGEHVELSTALVSIRGQIALNEGDYARASELAADALARRRAQVSATHPKVANALLLVGNVAYRAQDNARAGTAYREALSIREATFGPHHPQTAVAHNNVALALMAEGEHSAARDHLAKALAIWGPDADAIGVRRAQLNLQLVELAQGDFVAAERGLLALIEALGDEDATVVGVRSHALNALADVRSEQGRWPEAREALERSLSLWPEAHAERMGAHYRLARVLEALGDVGGARRELDATIAVAEKNYTADSITMLGARSSLAANVALAQDHERARALLASVFATAGVGFADNQQAATVHLQMGRAWARLGDWQRAAQWLDRAANDPRPDARFRAQLAVLQAEAALERGAGPEELRAAVAAANNGVGQSRPRYRTRLARLNDAVAGGV